jgi:hypothetical protein
MGGAAMSHHVNKACVLAGYMIGAGYIASEKDSGELHVGTIVKAAEKFIENYKHINWEDTSLSYANELANTVRNELEIFHKNNLVM